MRRLIQVGKIQLSSLPAMTFIWEMKVYNYQGLSGWSQYNWSSGPQMIATKPLFCSTIKQQSGLLSDNPAVQLTMKTKLGGVVKSWQGQIKSVLEQVAC